MDHKIDDSRIERARYEGDPSRKILIRLFVEGARNIVGYRVGYVPRGCEARQIDGGPVVPGPWAFTYGCVAVIDNYGGSRAEIDGEEANGGVIRAKVGDRLVIDGVAYRIGFNPQGREWLTLTGEST
jgi:hypothetical protein